MEQGTTTSQSIIQHPALLFHPQTTSAFFLPQSSPNPKSSPNLRSTQEWNRNIPIGIGTPTPIPTPQPRPNPVMTCPTRNTKGLWSLKELPVCRESIAAAAASPPPGNRSTSLWHVLLLWLHLHPTPPTKFSSGEGHHRNAPPEVCGCPTLTKHVALSKRNRYWIEVTSINLGFEISVWDANGVLNPKP